MAVKVTQALLEVAVASTGGPGAIVTQLVYESVYPILSYSPTSVTGAGVTRLVAEVMFMHIIRAMVAHEVLEVAFADTTDVSSGTGTKSFGYAT